jgi:hypothetical protein
MIEESVDKAEVLATTSGLLERTPGLRKITHPLVGVGSLLLRRAVRAEQQTMPAQPGPSDRRSYIPRDMTLSLFQAEHEEHLDRDRPDQVTSAPERRPMASRSVPPFSEGHGIDLGFVIGFLKSLPGNLLRRVLFRLPAGSPRPRRLADDARIVVVGDWGTGEGLAIDVADRMREAITAAGDRDVHVVHLGDVYYAGTRAEARNRFLDHWPVGPGEADRYASWCLNGNHDMYSAGEGLTRVTLTDPRFAAQRTTRGAVSTEFLLVNRHWSLIGLDTSWKYRWTDPRGGAGHLGRRQVRWLRQHVGGDDRRRTVLFSHHQPFTVNEDGGGLEPHGNLLDRTAGLRRSGKITGWFWGHEHKLIAYGARYDIGYATCMGHGAILEAPAEHPMDGEFTGTFTDPDGYVWRTPGFAVLDLDGPRMHVRYVDRTGRPWRPDDVLPPSRGGPTR